MPQPYSRRRHDESKIYPTQINRRWKLIKLKRLRSQVGTTIGTCSSEPHYKYKKKAFFPQRAFLCLPAGVQLRLMREVSVQSSLLLTTSEEEPEADRSIDDEPLPATTAAQVAHRWLCSYTDIFLLGVCYATSLFPGPT